MKTPEEILEYCETMRQTESKCAKEWEAIEKKEEGDNSNSVYRYGRADAYRDVCLFIGSPLGAAPGAMEAKIEKLTKENKRLRAKCLRLQAEQL